MKSSSTDMKLVAIIVLLALCSPFIAFTQIELLSDEFDDDSTFVHWMNINVVEGWNAEHLEVYDINTSTPGALHHMPYTTSWFEDYRGPLIFKEITGDFVFTTQVQATNRAADNLPSSSFSLAGVMIRTPRSITNGLVDWTPGGENYVFLSIGYALASMSNPPDPGPHFEAKTTIDGQSTLVVTPIDTNAGVQIRVARVGEHVMSLYRLPGQNWQIRARYPRADFPDTMQIGLVTYTDWPKLSTFSPTYANSHILNATADPDSSSNPGLGYNPDLIGRFEFARFTSVDLPASLLSADLSNESAVSDSTILAHFGYPSQPYIPGNIQYAIDSTGIEVRPDELNAFINIHGQLEDYVISLSDTTGNQLMEHLNLYNRLIIDKSSLPDLPLFIEFQHLNFPDLYLQRLLTDN